MVSAIEEGFPQREIQNAAYRSQLAMDRGQQEVVGVNVHQEEASDVPDLLKVDAQIGIDQIARLKKFRETRNESRVLETIDAIQQAASGTENLMPKIVDAVKADATLGEIADGLRAVFGEYQERVII